MNLHRMTRIALLTALSLILFVLEGFLPLPLPVPGAKLGLAAIVTLIALHLLPTRDAALMLTLTAAFGRYLIPHGGGGGTLIAIPRGIVAFIGVAAFIAFLSEGAVMDWSGVYLTAVRGMDLSLAGVGFSVFSAAMLLMRFLGDRTTQKVGQCPVAVGGALLTFVGILLVMFAPVDALLYLGFFAIGIGSANIVPVFFSLMGKQTVMPIGTAVSAVSTMGYLGILAGPAAIGFVSAHTSLTTAFGMLAALSLLQAVVGFYVFRKLV